MLLYTMKIGACSLAASIGFYLYFMAMNKCIKQNLLAIGQSIRSEIGSEIETEIKQKLIRKQLIEYIDFDSKVKR